MEGRLWDWSNNNAVHLWFRSHRTDVVFDPLTILQLNRPTTTGEVLRHIYSPKSGFLRNGQENGSEKNVFKMTHFVGRVGRETLTE